MTDENEIRGLIETLLAAIDAQDWERLSGLLSEDTRYEVSGFPAFCGRPAVMDYYRRLRPVKHGRHTIDEIIPGDGSAVCTGRFTGIKKSGEDIDILFADVIRLAGRRIKQRRVYFCQPAQ